MRDLLVAGSLAGGGSLGPVAVSIVPEPTSAVLLMLGLLTLVTVRQERNRRACVWTGAFTRLTFPTAICGPQPPSSAFASLGGWPQRWLFCSREEHMRSHTMRALLIGLSVVLCIKGTTGKAIEIDASTVIDAENSIRGPAIIGRNASAPITVTIMDGGSVGELLPTGSASVEMFGGTIGGDAFLTEDSQLELSGGTIRGTVYSRNFATVNIRGGAVLGYGDEIAITAGGNSVVNIYGGQIGEGPSLGWLKAWDSGTINVFGSNLGMVAGRVVGTLSDGTRLDRPFLQQDSGRIVLHNIPEPSTLVLLPIGVLSALVVLNFRGRLRRQLRSAGLHAGEHRTSDVRHDRGSGTTFNR